MSHPLPLLLLLLLLLLLFLLLPFLSPLLIDVTPPSLIGVVVVVAAGTPGPHRKKAPFRSS